MNMFRKTNISKSVICFIAYLIIVSGSVFSQNPHINAIRYARISPSGKYAVSCSDNVLCIWSLTEKKLLHTLQESTSDILFVSEETFYKAEYQDKKYVLSLYNVVSGKKEKTVFEKEGLTNTNLSPKGTYLAGKLKGYLYVVNLNTGQAIEKFSSYPSMATSTDLFFSYDEKYLYQVSNLQVFNRYIVETGEKDWEVRDKLNDKLMIRTVCNINEKCFLAGKFSVSDKNQKNFYVFGENKKELHSWTDVDFEPFKTVFNPVTYEVIMASSSNEVGLLNIGGNTFSYEKTKIKTKNFLRDIDISQNGKFLIVASSSGYGITKPNEKGYAKIEVYEWSTKKKIMEF